MDKDALKKKAHTLATSNQLLPALQMYEQICKTDSGDAEVWFMLSGIHGLLRQFKQAAECSRKSIALNPQNATAYMHLGSALQNMGSDDEALSYYQQALQINPSIAEAHFNSANILQFRSDYDAAEQHLVNAIQIRPNNAYWHYLLGKVLKMQGRVKEAKTSYDKALQLNPGMVEAYWNKLRIVPIIYDDESEIDFYRSQYAEGLNVLDKHLVLDSPQTNTNALRGIAADTNFFLQYQGRNDLELQCKFGELVHKVMTANYPQWAKPMSVQRIHQDERIRIGYASQYLRNHNGAVWLLGWLQHRDRNQFEIYSYYTGSAIDHKTEEFKQQSDHFYHFAGDLEKVCTQIAADNLHILVYPELGMEPLSVLMAGLRLAPVQCVGWGHPITSGLPTMDYWLSSDLMEPENGQDHYREKLVRLPNMAHYYSMQLNEQLQNQEPRKQRRDFNLREDVVLYLCSQSLFKYLPQYDYLFPEIAKQVPNAQFVFLSVYSVILSRQFIARLNQAFDNAGLKADDHCIMLNRLTQDDYVNLNQIADVFLDNPPWSGNNTTLKAIDCHLPVVTLPTEFMRGRHSYAILQMLGVMETIAGDEREYIDIAVRLGIDKKYRHDIARKISEHHDRICNDISCVRALEDFYIQALTPTSTGHD